MRFTNFRSRIEKKGILRSKREKKGFGACVKNDSNKSGHFETDLDNAHADAYTDKMFENMKGSPMRCALVERQV